MADEEYDYDGDYLEDGDNFFYVEETYSLADDLTENVIPDPGGFYDHTDDWDDLTRFDYWNDIEYDSDGYNDRAGLPTLKVKYREQVSDKKRIDHGRKRKLSVGATTTSKRPKLSRNTSTFIRDLPPVLFATPGLERQDPIVDVSNMASYAILPDWREKFKDIKSVAHVSDRAKVPTVEDEDVDEGVDEKDEDDELDHEMDPSAATEALSISLQNHLSKEGLDTSKIDRTKLFALAQKMMTQDDDAEDLLADFIEDMLGADEEDGDDAFTAWITSKAEPSTNHDSEHGTNESTMYGKDSMEVQEPIFGIPHEFKEKSVPRATEQTSNSITRKRKPESPDTSSKKRRNMSKKISI